MNKQGPLTLVLGSTGKTGSRVTKTLIDRGLRVRTAARSGAEVAFDWTRRERYARTLAGIDRLYLAPLVMRLDFADDVSAFLDEAEAAGVHHITFLSAYGMEHALGQVANRNVELDLLRRKKIGYTILRPAWFRPVLRQLTKTIASGRGSRPNGTAEETTGRPPRTFRNFVHSNANAWRAAR